MHATEAHPRSARKPDTLDADQDPVLWLEALLHDPKPYHREAVDNDRDIRSLPISIERSPAIDKFLSSLRTAVSEADSSLAAVANDACTRAHEYEALAKHICAQQCSESDQCDERLPCPLSHLDPSAISDTRAVADIAAELGIPLNLGTTEFIHSIDHAVSCLIRDVHLAKARATVTELDARIATEQLRDAAIALQNANQDEEHIQHTANDTESNIEQLDDMTQALRSKITSYHDTARRLRQQVQQSGATTSCGHEAIAEASADVESLQNICADLDKKLSLFQDLPMVCTTHCSS